MRPLRGDRAPLPGGDPGVWALGRDDWNLRLGAKSGTSSGWTGDELGNQPHLPGNIFLMIVSQFHYVLCTVLGLALCFFLLPLQIHNDSFSLFNQFIHSTEICNSITDCIFRPNVSKHCLNNASKLTYSSTAIAISGSFALSLSLTPSVGGARGIPLLGDQVRRQRQQVREAAPAARPPRRRPPALRRRGRPLLPLHTEDIPLDSPLTRDSPT